MEAFHPRMKYPIKSLGMITNFNSHFPFMIPLKNQNLSGDYMCRI